jgi:hypothetical protein
LILLTQTVPTTVFGLAVCFFALFGPPISALGLAMILTPAEQPTLIGTVSLASKAVPTNAKRYIAPSTLELK